MIKDSIMSAVPFGKVNEKDLKIPESKQAMNVATHSHTPEKNKSDWQQSRTCRDVTDGNGNIVIPHLG